MNYIEKTYNGCTELSLKSQQLDLGIIYLTSDITSDILSDITEQFIYLENKKDCSHIIILIDSLGGEVQAGLYIIDLIQASTKPVYTACLSKAYSMGAIILSAGNIRYALPHSKVMIHEPLIQKTGGSATSIQKTAEDIMDTKKNLVDILTKYTKQSTKQIEKAISFDNYMDTEAAIKFGIIDKTLNNLNDLLKAEDD